MPEHQHSVITLSRQMGSGGTYIGYLLAKELGFKYADREILRQAAQYLKTDEGYLDRFEGRSSGLLANILRGLSLGTPETISPYPLNRPVYDKDLFTLECKIMNDMADLHDVVIIGRGGFYALRNRPGVTRVFIHAPLDFRIKRLMEVQNITDNRQARADIEESDQSRAKFIRDMVGVNWTDSLNYHIAIDSSRVSCEASVRMIMKLMAGSTSLGLKA
ncbi:MAG: cytidylate kinase-like family protein [Syntrophaceae bacterium]